MKLYERWIRLAYNAKGQTNSKIWDDYMPLEQKVYENILENKTTEIKGTVKDLAEKYNFSPEYMAGFIDGINDIQSTPVDLKELTEDTEITLNIDFKTLYKKMVEFKADHLYSLPQWKNIFTEEEMEVFYKEQKTSGTFKRDGEKVGRNDPCPCGSGKKYKKCCGMN